MSRGVLPSALPCSFCHRNAVDVDATWYEGLPYHERCFKLYLLTEIRNYNKKQQLGTITLADNCRFKDFQEMYDIERLSLPQKPVSQLINPELANFTHNSALALNTIDRQTFISTGEKRKKLGGVNTPEKPMFLPYLKYEGGEASTPQKGDT